MSAMWTPAENAAFELMLDAKLTIQQMATLTGRTESAIKVRRSLVRPNRKSDRLRAEIRHPAAPEPVPADALSYSQRVMTANMIACQWHLIDLKRAGHSPTRTELKIGQDAACPMRMPLPLAARTLTGSHAAMCADNAGRG